MMRSVRCYEWQIRGEQRRVRPTPGVPPAIGGALGSGAFGKDVRSSA